MKFIALLRGVNVNGIKITNQALKESMQMIGLDVTPVLQTGNMIFESNLNTNTLKDMIETQLRSTFEYDAFIVLKTESEIRQVLTQYPFELSDAMQPYVIFSNDENILNQLSIHEFDANIEFVERIGNNVYWTVKKGLTLDSPFGKSLGKVKFKPYMTSRNLRTIEKIIQKLN